MTKYPVSWRVEILCYVAQRILNFALQYVADARTRTLRYLNLSVGYDFVFSEILGARKRRVGHGHFRGVLKFINSSILVTIFAIELGLLTLF